MVRNGYHFINTRVREKSLQFCLKYPSINMFISVIAVFLAVTASCLADDKSEMQQIEELISDSILDEIDDNDDSPEVSAAVRYMIPVPIRVRVPVPVPRQAPERQPPYPYPERQRYPQERDPIVAVPIGLTPGRYGRRPSWRPIGPPVIAVPVGSATRYPLPDRDDDAYEGRVLSSPSRISAAASIRTTRSISTESKAEEHKEEELATDMSPKEVPVVQRAENPLKVSTKASHKSLKPSSEKRYRPKRQLDTYAIQRGSYVRPASILVPVQPQHVVYTPVAVPRTQDVPVPVYVPMKMNLSV